jgi:predicted  nucleic acid-binding Zn-ribbon protein
MKYDKIVHIGDIHIRLLKRHEEYNNVFNNLYKYIDGIDGNKLIVVAGDIVHGKLDINSELVYMIQRFFKSLSELGKTVVIPGNHDMNLKNKNRMDPLFPVIEALSNDNLIYLNETTYIDLDNVTISTTHVTDDITNTISPTTLKSDNHKVLIYHGMIQGSTTDIGHKLEGGVDLKYFEGYDFVLLGDIHKRQYFNKHTAYCGSLVQQNYGESHIGHGGIVWDLNTKESTNFDIENDTIMYTIKLTPKNKTELDIPELKDKRVKLRVLSDGLDVSELSDIEILLKNKYNIVNYLLDGNNTTAINSTNDFNVEEQKNITVQKQLITEYINENYEVSDKIVKSVIDLHTELFTSIQDKYVREFNTLTPIELKFSNMFSYGKNNTLDFTQLSNIVGIFAENASGKSSIMDILLYTCFDKSLKTSESGKVINNNKDTFKTEFTFKAGDILHKITRVGKRTKISVKVDVDFVKYVDNQEISLNGDKRASTNKVIKSVLGGFDEFVLSFLSPQKTNINFLEMTQSERKDVLSNFLDISFYDELHNTTKDKSRELKNVITHLEKTDFGTEISIIVDKIKELKNELVDATNKYDSVKEDLSEKIELLSDIKSKKKEVNHVTDDIDTLTSNLNKYEQHIESNSEKLVEAEHNQKDIQSKLDDIILLDDDKLEKLNSAIIENNDLKEIKRQLEQKLKHISDTEDSLSKHEYDSNCEYCVKNEFVISANKIVATKSDIEVELNKITEEYSEEKHNKFLELKEKYNHTLKQHSDLSGQLSRNTSDINTIINNSTKIKDKILNIKNSINKYNESKDNIEFNKSIDKEIEILNLEINDIKRKEKQANDDVVQIKGNIKSNSDKLKDIEEKYKEYKEMVVEYKTYDIYSKITHRNSIPLTIVEKSLPVIERRMNEILSQFVDFKIKINLESNNIKFSISYPNGDWDVDLVSGMERFMISIVFKVALLSISNLPKSNFMFIDEGFGVLDKKHFNVVVTLFEVFRRMFDFVLIVSHIEEMRDYVDDVIDIGKNNNYSHIFNING